MGQIARSTERILVILQLMLTNTTNFTVSATISNFSCINSSRKLHSRHNQNESTIKKRKKIFFNNYRVDDVIYVHFYVFPPPTAFRCVEL